MTRRAAQLAELRLEAEGLGKPPVPYAVLVLGSGGRGESQLAADQDNAIVYAEGGEGSPADLYLARLADVMCEILDAAGIPFCKGGVMAKNRAWRMSMADWRHRIDDWIGRQRPEDLLNVDIFFDAAPVHGDLAMGEAIWNYAFERGHRAVDFIKLLTENARRRGQPFTLLGNFRLDDKGRIDVKKFGLMPIFTSARVLAIRHDIRHRSTPERLQAAADRGIGSAEIIASIIEAQEVLIGTVLRQQLADLDAGLALTTFVSPARLDKAQRAQLKQALTIVDEAIGLVSEGRL
jgi:DNA polymerase-3 subunit epsilon/CBS domain-containing protein